MQHKYSFIIALAVTVFGLAGCGGGDSGGPAPHQTSVVLPETGQTTCYNTTGTVITCAGTGQDGELRAGVSWPSPRFTVGTGVTVDCVTDNLTGLMWVRSPSTNVDTWPNALTSANDLTLCGFSDWRLPNVNELESLVNSEVANPATWLNTQGFNGIQAHSYWSSSSDASSVVDAWYVALNSGRVSATTKSGFNYVLPVRAGQ